MAYTIEDTSALLRAPNVTANELILALVAEAATEKLSLSKTKLLKLIYLIDVESYRALGRSATAWRWMFHQFGPWTADYDASLESLGAVGMLATTQHGDDRETHVIRGRGDHGGLAALSDPETRLVARRVIERWLSRDVSEILDHVYFETEPMQDARWGTELNFGTVGRADFPAYRREVSRVTPERMQEIRERLGLISPPAPVVPESRSSDHPQFTPPRYDEAALELLATLEDD